MKIISILLACIIILSCSQKPDGKISIAKNKSQSEAPTQKKEEDPWIPIPELFAYIKTAQKIEHTIGIVSPFDTLDYNKIIAYKFWNRGEGRPRVFSEYFLVKEIEMQLALSQSQADQILRLLNRSSTYGGTKAACFEPRFGLVFYKDNKMVTQINICMECNYLESEVVIPVFEKQKEEITSGFSKRGWESLRAFQTEIGFLKEEKTVE